MFIRDGSSIIRYQYPLECDPELPSLAKRHNITITSADQSSMSSMSPTDLSSLTGLERAIRLIYDKKYDAATAICDSIIRNSPDTKDAIHAQSLLGRISRRTGKSDFSSYLSRNVQQYGDFEISVVAQRTQARLLAGQRDYHQAVSLLESIRNNSKFKDSSIHKCVLFDLIDIYHFDLKQDAVAKKYLDELATLFPNDDLVTIAEQKLNPVPAALQSAQIHTAAASLATPFPYEFVLEQNHPNPFNSTTAIRYQLPRECQVTIAIYNMLGQNIRTLVRNQWHQAGFHVVSWDGKNDVGQEVGTGVYWYQLRAGDFVGSKKLVVLK